MATSSSTSLQCSCNNGTPVLCGSTSSSCNFTPSSCNSISSSFDSTSSSCHSISTSCIPTCSTSVSCSSSSSVPGEQCATVQTKNATQTAFNTPPHTTTIPGALAQGSHNSSSESPCNSASTLNPAPPIPPGPSVPSSAGSTSSYQYSNQSGSKTISRMMSAVPSATSAIANYSAVGSSAAIIVGSSVGGFIGLIILLSGLIYCLRRRNRKLKFAPSAEFMAYAASRHNPTPTADLALIRDSSIERDTLPPTRTSTRTESYPSPALEKLLEAVAQMRVLQPKEGNHELEEGRPKDDFMGM